MNTSILQRLLSHPHAAVFEKGAQDELVFRVRHPSSLTWVIQDGWMTVSVGESHSSYDLSATTVSGLVGALRVDGFEVIHVSSRFDTFSALVLTEGRGDQFTSNGDHIKAFTSLLWALFTGYGRELAEAERQVRQALLQMVIGTAEGEWLDLWGALYSVQRLDGESDAAYRIRIPKEAFRIRVNAVAIELAIKDLTGKDVRILEPWTTVFTLDQSDLSGSDLLQDGERVGPFYIQPFSSVPILWDDVLPIVLRNKPAGVIMLPPQLNYGIGVSVPNDWTIGTSIRRDHTASVLNEDVALLDYSEIEETSVPNHPFQHFRSILRMSGVVVGSTVWPPHPWSPIPWNQLSYLVTMEHQRSYRVYDNLVVYAGNFWLELPWFQDRSWSSINSVIGTGHSRSS